MPVDCRYSHYGADCTVTLRETGFTVWTVGCIVAMRTIAIIVFCCGGSAKAHRAASAQTSTRHGVLFQ